MTRQTSGTPCHSAASRIIIGYWDLCLTLQLKDVFAIVWSLPHFCLSKLRKISLIGWSQIATRTYSLETLFCLITSVNICRHITEAIWNGFWTPLPQYLSYFDHKNLKHIISLFLKMITFSFFLKKMWFWGLNPGGSSPMLGEHLPLSYVLAFFSFSLIPIQTHWFSCN